MGIDSLGFLVDNLSGTLKTTESWLVKTGHFFAHLACDFSSLRDICLVVFNHFFMIRQWTIAIRLVTITCSCGLYNVDIYTSITAVLFSKVSSLIYSPFDPLLYGNRAQSYLKLKKLR